MSKIINSTTKTNKYEPLDPKAREELKKEHGITRANQGLSETAYRTELSSRMNVDKRTLDKWWGGEKIALKMQQRIETYLSDQYDSCTLVWIPDGDIFFDFTRKCTDYIVEAAWQGDIDEEKTGRISEVLENLEKTILEIHSEIDETDLIKVINRKNELITKSNKLISDAKEKDVNLYYAYVPSFLHPNDAELGNTSVVLIFCINLVPIPIIDNKRPADFAFVPRWPARKNIRTELGKKQGLSND